MLPAALSLFFECFVIFGVLCLPGVMTLGLVQGRRHQAIQRWNITGSILAASEPFLLSHCDDVMTLWDRRNGTAVQSVTVGGPVLSVIAALREIRGQKPSISAVHLSVRVCSGEIKILEPQVVVQCVVFRDFE